MDSEWITALDNPFYFAYVIGKDLNMSVAA
uniref:Uncharacterized protein n=1 Tax=Rhizophora mucronata TaxID=61149 RepID=A0A2P2L1I7_RHIMU